MSNDLVAREIDLQSLALELARNNLGAKVPIPELLGQLHIDENHFLAVANDPVFRKQVASFTRELSENGVSFQLKAKIQAEEMLKRNWRIVHDPDTPPAVAVKAIENTVRWAGLEPKTSGPGTTAPGSGFSITFNIPAAPAVAYSDVSSPAITITQQD